MTRYSAAASAIGYLYQFRLALLLALQDETRSVLIEALDDVEVVEGDGGKLLFQLKHVDVGANLSDLSRDLWKTLRVWADQYPSLASENVHFMLVTTGTAQDGSVAALLREPHRHVAQILERLENLSAKSENQHLQPAFAAYRRLTAAQQRELVLRTRVIDGYEDIQQVEKSLLERLAIAVPPDHREPALESLEGWWLKVAINSVRSSSPIPCAVVFSKVRDIGWSYSPLSLPVSLTHAVPEEEIDPEKDTRPFVLQLKALSVDLKRIENAILDYYRAFEQRAKWVREDLIVEDDLGEYEDRLVDEWDRMRLVIADELEGPPASEDALRKAGRKLLAWMELQADQRIRPGVADGFIIRGSYHILADAGPDCRVWWHPHFPQRVAEILGLSSEGASA